MAVEGKADDWFVYKVPHKARSSSADAGAGLGLMQDTVNVGRHTITEVRRHGTVAGPSDVRQSLTRHALQDTAQQLAAVAQLLAAVTCC